MEKKIKSCLMLYGLILPAKVRELLIELGAELDRLRAEVEQMRSK
jgi:hypothetical protein